MTKILELKNIYKSYKQGDIVINVLNDISMDFYAGELTVIVGRSGSGKSTLLHIAGMLEKQDSGMVNLNVENNTLSQEHLRLHHIGFVYQDHYLLSDFTVIENIQIPKMIVANKKIDKDNDSLAVLEKLNIAHRMHSYPHQLSGGERQRVAIARAIANNPKLILADEPTGNLDQENAQIVLNILYDLAKKYNIAVTIVTHSNDIIAKADRIYRI